MTDPVFQNALERKARLERELKEVDEFLRLYKRFSKGGVERAMNVASMEAEVIPADKSTEQPSRRSVSQDLVAGLENPTKEQLQAHIRKVIDWYKRPMTRGELLTSLDEAEITIYSKDVGKYIGTVLWRLKDTFVNLEGYGYWLRDRPFPPAGYLPPASDPNSGSAIAHTLNIEPKSST